MSRKRKLNIPKSKQITGLRKAIRNPNTPRGFLPSLKKRLAKLGGSLVLAFLVLGCAARSSAQTPVTIQPYQQPVVNGATCTGSEQDYPLNNRNLNQHSVTIVASGAFTYFAAEIDGLTATNVVRISDQFYNSFSGGSNAGILTASGYYPQVRVSLTCTGGTSYSIFYSGVSGASQTEAGSSLVTTVDKVIGLTQPANANKTYVVQTPYGSASSFLLFNWSGSTGPSGSTLSVQCVGSGPASGYSFNLALDTASTYFQTIPLPNEACVTEDIVFTSGGASANTYTIEQLFNRPGLSNPLLGNYSHITATTATAVKAKSGTLLSVNVNTPAAGTISVFDLPAASCTGTPSTHTVAVITATSTAPLGAIPFNQLFQQGICIQASAAMDLTIGYQ